MSTLVLETEPLAKVVVVTDVELTVDLADGRRIMVPLAWYPRLLSATAAERGNWLLLGEGYAIEWPDLDEHIGIEGLLAGRMSGESRQSLERWLAARSSAAADRAPSPPSVSDALPLRGTE
jgi:hypothetical protein